METAIRAEGLSKRFGTVRALDGLNLEVRAGEVFGYLGPNGAGKTTTIRLLLGMLRPTSGRAEIFGLDAQKDTVAAHRRLAYVGGETSLWPSLTGAETAYGIVAWSFLVEIIGAGLGASRWLLDTSVLHHITRAPAAAVNWDSLAILTAIGIAAAIAGTVAFTRRDLAGA